MRAIPVVSLLFPIACSSGGGAYDPHVDPTAFSTTIDNPLLPWVPGTMLTYEENDDTTVIVTVTSDVRTVDGVDCVVVHDAATDRTSGDVFEDTYDWYAQDADGNVWYFGEDTTAYEGGGTSTAGSWEAGVGDAKPGIVMEADPQVGDSYRQEYDPGNAEDEAEVIEVGVAEATKVGDYAGCVRTRETSALEPDLEEEKVYCPGVGEVQADDVAGGSDHSAIETFGTAG